jgi:hypothetical protein
MKEKQNIKKEIYLYLILIHLNLKPAHRINFITEAIERCIFGENSLLADSLMSSLSTNLEKLKID